MKPIFLSIRSKIQNSVVLFTTIFLISSTLLAQEGATSTESSGASSGGGYREKLIDFNVLGKEEAESDYLQNGNWVAKLNDSADHILNKKLTYVKNVKNAKGNNYLGVRVNFPDMAENAYAEVKPFFNISFFPLKGKSMKGRGAIGNVGNIKKILVKVAGRNFPHELFVVLEDNNAIKNTYNMGSLRFYGWKTLEWNNPNYLEDVRQRDLDGFQVLYPRILPSVRLDSLVLRKQRYNPTGNFVTYFEHVSLVYDKAYDEVTDEEKEADDYIDDEAMWNINTKDIEGEAKLMQEKLDNYRFLQERERRKMNLKNVGGVPTPNETASPTPPAGGDGVVPPQ